MANLDKTQIGLAGEYYVLAQLSARGFIATLTLGNTKGVDILVTNQEINKLFKVEVKTTIGKPRIERLFSNRPMYIWPMSKKHEAILDEKLIYCFVHMTEVDKLPKFFLIPSKDVAAYVKWQHEYWLKTRKNKVKETTMRNFRIEVDDPNSYENNWDIFK
ncbi:unnamed protein product [marine sediment metagenome]|uniref:Aspartate ammonia-lyase n=1 Tax=marine sediment metagenome TaxID=412755 RepID=X0V6I1_9ZZZZ